MATTPISSVTAGNTLASQQTAATKSLGSGNQDLNRFLTLLTAQLKYQDPMNPTDATQFVAQLAQFSQVEQQTKSNTLLQKLADASAGNQLTQVAGLIGKQVTAAASSLAVPASGAAAPVSVTVNDVTLSSPRLLVKDAAGTVLRSIPVSSGTSTVTFDGNDAKGQRLPADVYALSLVGTDSKGQAQTAGSISTAGRVAEVRSQASGGYQLVLEDGRSVDASGLTSLMD
ncbi:flagellar hook assembly protein FlgD [Paracraurococcus lichenis]|uniref:Basal-body rod modification protein FlgD n=1 Tax=Paracraurococcus lichenis TaxID=3064888 RepID=A0ABT9EB20_9PROT|nr:flagellar hook capping FlgD N-terminal domain-containing protein [Paracraurococcus sp. LOR1-02]MDO9713374.1 flagellar hook capping FlgD N-terminal domain-containing protein [Paracraurococcus sp. LOR1-02]